MKRVVAIAVVFLFSVSCLTYVGLTLSQRPPAKPTIPQPPPPVGAMPELASPNTVASGNPNILACQITCQSGQQSCQSACNMQYSASTQLASWSQCRQSCGAKQSSCATACAQPTQPLPGAAQTGP